MAESSSFAFLREHDAVFFQLASTAERVFASDPNVTLIKLRQLGEALAQDLAAIKYQRDTHHQAGRRLPEGHGADDLQVGGCQADPCLQSGRELAVPAG